MRFGNNDDLWFDVRKVVSKMRDNLSEYRGTIL